MIYQFQKFLVTTLIIILSIHFMVNIVYAQPTNNIEIDPDIRAIRITSSPQQIFMRSRKEGEGLRFQWDIKGKGELKGDTTSPAIFYIPPTEIEKKLAIAIITVIVTEATGEKMTERVIFTLLDPTSPIKQQDFNLILTTDKQQYVIGEAITVTLKADKDCYVWLFHWDIHGNITQLFPNQWRHNNFIQTGQVVTIPHSEHDFKIVVSAPPGVEMITAIARIERPEDQGKGVTLTAPPIEVISESMISYKTVP